MSEVRSQVNSSGHSGPEALLDAIGAHLDRSQELLSGIDLILDRTGHCRQDVARAFGSVDCLLVALAKRFADQLGALLTRDGIKDVAAARDILIRFGIAVSKEYTASFVGLVRLVIAEGARSKELRDKVYEAGPARVSRELCEFLAAARDAEVLDLPEPALATEQLMGVLREPLYQALLLHPIAESVAERSDVITAAIDLFLDGCARRSL